jgi:hypothetical protein
MRRLIGIVIAILTLAGSATSATAAEPDPASRIVSPNRDPYGVSYEEWTQRYMEWVFLTPGAANPLFNPSCNNLVDRVWYMPQTFIGNTEKLHCVVGNTTPILISPAGTLCDTSYVPNPRTLRSCADVEFSGLSGVRVWIDGIPIPDLDQWIFSTPVFRISWPADNGFDVPPGSYLAAAKAHVLMLRPLSVGRHTIVVHDRFGEDVARVTAFLKVVARP